MTHRPTFDELLAEADAVLVCSRCDEAKPRDCYYRTQLTKRRGKPYCKDCRRAAINTAIRKDRQRARARRADARTRLAELKMTLSCVDCGWSPPTERECWRLHFDHIDPATKTSRRTEAFDNRWRWERIVAEIALCEPRCVSCHGYRTNRQRRGIDPYPIPWSRTSPLPHTPTPAQSAS